MEWRVTQQTIDEFAKAFWAEAAPATVYLFHGAMGAGKTTLITALCRAKGVTGAVSSPTFSIINEYDYSEHGDLKKLFHIDLYRLKGEAEVVQAGVEDVVYSGAVCFVEWPEIAPILFDASAVHIIITPLTDTERRVQCMTSAAYQTHSAAQAV